MPGTVKGPNGIDVFVACGLEQVDVKYLGGRLTKGSNNHSCVAAL